MNDEDFLTKPQVYRILRVLKDQEDAVASTKKKGSNKVQSREVGLSKEKIYDKVPGSKQIKVECVRELQSKGFIRIESVKDLERRGALDNDYLKKGKWNSKFVTLLEPGRNLLKRLDFVKDYDPNKDRTVRAVKVSPTYEKQAFFLPEAESAEPAVDRFTYGSRLVSYELASLIEELKNPKTFESEADLEQVLEEVDKTVLFIHEHMEGECEGAFLEFFDKYGKYKALEIGPEAVAVLIRDLLSTLQENLDGARVDGAKLLNDKMTQTSEKLKEELPGTYEGLHKDLDDVSRYLTMLFE